MLNTSGGSAGSQMGNTVFNAERLKVYLSGLKIDDLENLRSDLVAHYCKTDSPNTKMFAELAEQEVINRQSTTLAF